MSDHRSCCSCTLYAQVQMKARALVPARHLRRAVSEASVGLRPSLGSMQAW